MVNRLKILVTSDLHGNSYLLDKLKEAAKNTDLILIAGDITGKHFFCQSLQSLSSLQEKDEKVFNRKLSMLNIPYRYILGNDDWIDGHSKHLLKKPEQFSPVSVVPFPWVSITPFSTNREMNENMLSYQLSKIKPTEHMIVLAHTPPLYHGDLLFPSKQHCGSKTVLDWIKQAQPAFWLCGHIHENYSISKIGETIVLNAACEHESNLFRGWIINTDSMSAENIIIP